MSDPCTYQISRACFPLSVRHRLERLRGISLHPKNYTKLIKFTCFSKDLLPCIVSGFSVKWRSHRRSSPFRMSVLLMVIKTGLLFSGGLQWHTFHAKVRETLSVGSKVYLGPGETAW
jgi:hypothetical protein